MASDIDPRFIAQYQRGHEDDPLPTIPEPPIELAEISPRIRRNPWLPVLWVLSLALLAFGLWAQWYSQRLFAAPNLDNVTEYYIIPNLLSTLSPWFAIVGLASLVGVVFLHAVRWREQ